MKLEKTWAAVLMIWLGSLRALRAEKRFAGLELLPAQGPLPPGKPWVCGCALSPSSHTRRGLHHIPSVPLLRSTHKQGPEPRKGLELGQGALSGLGALSWGGAEGKGLCRPGCDSRQLHWELWQLPAGQGRGEQGTLLGWLCWGLCHTTGTPREPARTELPLPPELRVHSVPRPQPAISIWENLREEV